DFRARLDLVLHHPEEVWQSIDPGRWVTERGYNQRGLDQSLESFLAAREESVTWLKGLASPDWTAVYEAPFGRISSGDVMAAWVAHDLLHLRQLIELRWAYLVVQVEPYRVRYAGAW
ncbi:MAG: DinB family protein, partial [Anaerolineae bacterium]